MDLICASCGKPYRKPASQAARSLYCSVACKHAAMHKDVTTRRRYRRQPNHPLAGPAGYVSEARAVLFDKIGPGPHSCHWCERSIDWLFNVRGHHRDGITADHVNNDPLDDRPENLVPACGPCNGVRSRAIKESEPYVTRANGERSRVKRAPCAKCGREFNATYGRVCGSCRAKLRA